MIRILLAEDQEMLRGALASLLELQEDIEVVAQVSNGIEAINAMEKIHPDLCILDVEIPHLTGLEVAERIRANGLGCRIIIVTTFTRPGYLKKAMELKVDGYLLKDEPIDFLVDAIRRVMKGERILSSEVSTAIFLMEENPLTEREQEILRLAKEGNTTAQISRVLFLTKGTVRNYMSSAIQKLEVESRQQAISKATEQGWI